MNMTSPEHFVWNHQKSEQDDAIDGNDHQQGNDQGYESNVEATHLHDHEMMDARQNSSMHIQHELQCYIISCVCQIFWTVSTCEQVMSWSIFFLVCHILVLGHLIHGQLDHHLDPNTNTSNTMRHYWIYCFPHQVNLSWLYYLLVLFLQIVNQQLAMYFKSQITWAFISIAFIFFVGVYHGYLASDNYPTITLSLALLMVISFDSIYNVHLVFVGPNVLNLLSTLSIAGNRCRKQGSLRSSTIWSGHLFSAPHVLFDSRNHTDYPYHISSHLEAFC